MWARWDCDVLYARPGHTQDGKKVVRTVGLLHFQNASSLSAALSIVDGLRMSYATSIHDDDKAKIKTIQIQSIEWD